MFRIFGGKKTIYADYASGTPLDSKVKKAMFPYLFLGSGFGNPASVHSFGRKTKQAVDESRKSIARQLQVQPDEIIFTGGGTEGNNLAISGVLFSSPVKRPHIITTSIEHSSVLEPIRAWEGRGALVTYLPVDASGRINMGELKKAITSETVLVSIAYANGEIGTVEKIREIGNVVEQYRKKQPIYFHTDASQAAQFFELMPNDLRVDLLTLDASKLYGPKGVGALFVKRGTPITPLVRGGGQERGLRPGTENVSGIVGLSTALKKTAEVRESETLRTASLRNLLRRKIIEEVPEANVNGEGEILPHFLNICIPGVDAEFLSVRLDREGVAVSSASACRSISGSGSSYVIEALPGRAGCGKSSLRISLGRETTLRDIERIAATLTRLLRS